MKTHLILGGGGFLGRHVGLALARSGARVRLASRGHAPPLEGAPASLTFERLDLHDPGLAAALDGVDVVHHYAWSSVPSTAHGAPLGDLQENVAGAVKVLEALKDRPGVRLVFTSSGGTVYGLTDRPSREDDPLAPASFYGVGKAAAERYIDAYQRLHGLDARILRLGNPFGAGQGLVRQQGLATALCRRALAGETTPIFGDGAVVRDYFHVSDAVDALVRAAETDLPDDAPRLFNIGSGEGASVSQLIALVSEALGRLAPVERRAASAADLPYSVLDATRAAEVLGWRPKLTLAEGVRRTLDDFAAGAAWWSSLDP